MKSISKALISLSAVALLLAVTPVLAQDEAMAETAADSATNPTVIIHTNHGDITLELDADKAPVSVENFIAYVNEGYYAGTVFHRVISHFMIQGGGMTPDLTPKPTAEPIANEAHNGLSNVRGSIAMARTNDPDSATSQFFINVQDNLQLDHGPTSSGYSVFGHVTEGMEVVDEIRFVETTSNPPYHDVPVEPVIIESVEVVEAQ